MESKPINSIQKFNQYIAEQLPWEQKDYIFRGHADVGWELKPKIARLKSQPQRIYNLEESVFYVEEENILK